jgi:arylsulfatase A-like enzyme
VPWGRCVPGAPIGIQKRDITIAHALKSQGYATGQFGKNHLGDKDEFLPTNHGFDEFFGNLYHLNAEEEPERAYWPKDDPDFVKSRTPRGVIHSYADGKIEDTGTLTAKRMEPSTTKPPLLRKRLSRNRPRPASHSSSG